MNFMRVNNINGSMRITIPNAIAKNLGLRTRDLCAVMQKGNTVIIKKMQPVDILKASDFLTTENPDSKAFYKHFFNQVDKAKKEIEHDNKPST